MKLADWITPRPWKIQTTPASPTITPKIATIAHRTIEW
jgi:hypothetical protein